jgi:predicted enzyme related to lactoylglutathione lyase
MKEEPMGAPVTWFEINSTNSKALQEFYAKVFDWKLRTVGEEPPYAMVDTDADSGIGGGIGEAQGPRQVIFYIEVDDPQTYLDQIQRLGGRTVMPVTEIPEMVTFAQFADPEGNVIGLVKGS